MWLLLILAFILGYLLFAPCYLEINSAIKIVRIRFHQMASAQLLMHNKTLFIEIKIAGWQKSIDLLAPKAKIKKVKKTKPKKQKTIPLTKIKSIIRSFKVNQCYINLDFENVKYNTMLLPLFYGISRLTQKEFHINFIGQNQINLQIENNIARIIWAYLKH
jgi:hypothetical protein